LKRAIQSVLDQTYPELECIVVDDASKDDTDQIINSFEDDRLKYFRHEKNKGASAARNTGIRQSKGGLIAFLDDDDEWIATKLEKQVPLLKGLPERFGMVYCWMDYYDANNKLIHQHHPTLKGYVFPQVLDAQRLGGCPTLLVKRNVVDQIGGFDESLPRGNDGDFIRRVCRKYEVDYVPEVLVKVYTEHGSERISSKNKESIKNAIKGEKIKFSKFHKELNALPEQKSNIYTHIGNHYAALRHFKSAFRYYLKAIIASPKNRKYYKTLIKKMIS
jgi:glycosyltransferase involved in cell wall biosynthesis